MWFDTVRREVTHRRPSRSIIVFSSVGALSSSFWYNPFHVPSGRSAQRAVSALLFSTNKLPARSNDGPVGAHIRRRCGRTIFHRRDQRRIIVRVLLCGARLVVKINTRSSRGHDETIFRRWAIAPRKWHSQTVRARNLSLRRAFRKTSIGPTRRSSSFAACRRGRRGSRRPQAMRSRLPLCRMKYPLSYRGP